MLPFQLQFLNNRARLRAHGAAAREAADGQPGTVSHQLRHRVGIPFGPQLADGHGDFIARVAPGTVYTVFQHFVAQGLTIGDAEAEVLEEGGDAGEETDARRQKYFSISCVRKA